jgi:hypothetical protein
LKIEQTSSRFARRIGSIGGLGMLAAVVGLAGSQPGCAERIGHKAAAGAISELKRHAAEEDQNKQPSRVAGARAVEGAVSALDEPQQREAIQRLVAEAVSVATRTAVDNATQAIIAQLGPDGRGPLGVSLSRTGERVSASAVGGLGSELATLLPECNGPDRMDCINKRLQETARTTAASFTKGVKDSIGWHLLLIMFALGAGGGVLGAWLWSLRLERRRSFRARTA